MSNVLYTNVRILDGSGEHPYIGEVLVQGNRIRRVARGSRAIPMNGNIVIDGAGATLMPVSATPIRILAGTMRPASKR